MITDEVRKQLEELVKAGLRMPMGMALNAGVPAGDEEGETTRWHLIAVEGEWDGHWQGAFKLEASDFKRMAFQFRSMENDTVVDYEHASMWTMFTGKAPAAGWITALDVRDTDQGLGLFARIRWTEAAAASIKAEEYKYLSPTILWRTTDRKTGVDLGTSLHSVALTNTPFLDELPEVRLNSSWIAALQGAPNTGASTMNPEQLAAINAVLGLKSDATFDTMLEQIRSLQGEGGGLEKVCNALGLQGASVDAMVITATALREEIAQLQIKAAQVDKLTANALVARAKTEGKITASNEEWCSKLAIENPAVFSSWAASAPVIIPNQTKQRSSEAGSGNTPTLDAADIDRLCKNADVIAECKAAQIDDVKFYVTTNLASLLEQHA